MVWWNKHHRRGNRGTHRFVDLPRYLRALFRSFFFLLSAFGSEWVGVACLLRIMIALVVHGGACSIFYLPSSPKSRTVRGTVQNPRTIL